MTAHTVRVWRIPLDVSTPTTDACLPLLSSHERERYAGFGNGEAADRFVLTRAALRFILSEELDQAPSEVEIVHPPRGKPVLATGGPPYFSVAHTDGLALIAIASIEVGVDVERIRPLRNPTRFAAWLATTEQDTATLFRAWTRREAAIKLGGGRESTYFLDVPVPEGYSAALACGQMATIEAADSSWTEQIAVRERPGSSIIAVRGIM